MLSDSVQVRRRLKDAHGAKVLTTIEIVEHSASGVDTDVLEGNLTSLQGFQAAVWEHWLFSMTDFQIITHHSGFGRTAAFRSLPRVTFYSCSLHESPKPCGPSDNNHIHETATHFAGI